MAARQYELVVYGATGYTGRQAVAYLAPRAAHLELRWAIAGRNESKLIELAAGLPEPRPAIVVADADDSDSLASLAADATAVVSFAGPHALLGDELPKQCIATETHYADLCGENDVIAKRVAQLDGPAREAGVKLIPACGYESVPFDLGVLGLHRAFFGTDGSCLQEVDVEVRLLFHRSPLRYGQAVSGGTMATVARLLEAGDLTDTRRFARAAGTPSPPGERPKFDMKARRSADRDWLAPLIPVPFLNPAVVQLTSTRLADDGGGYSPTLVYREALNTSASFGSSLFGGLAAKGSSALVRRLAAISQGRHSFGDRATVAILKALGPKPGDGPPLASLDTIDYRIDLQAHSTSGLAVEGIVRGVGDPGYRSSTNILAEAGVALARDRSLPRRSGVLTPASGLGIEFLDPLANAGLSFDFGTPRGGHAEAA